MNNQKGGEKILCWGCESTAHTFSCAVVESFNCFSGHILSDIREVYSPPAGSGIHPREASRHHMEIAASVIKESLSKAGISMKDVDSIAFSAGPGLGPCLRIGAVVSRSLAAFYNKPLISVNHAIGHIELAMTLTGANNPIVLLVSGGHTIITSCILGRWRIFGETLDLTIGQLIDQFGREAGFSSPSGKKIEALASNSNKYIPLPYTVKGNDVSFSGVLTEAKRKLHSGKRLDDLCFSIQEIAFAMLAEVTERALAFTEKTEVLLAGGVAANKKLQLMINEVAKRHNAKFHVVPNQYSGDCGAQIAWAGLLAHSVGMKVSIEKSRIHPSWRLDQVDVKWRN